MRLLLTLMLMLTFGCTKRQLTIPAASIAPYAAGETVQTREGVSLNLDDGGRLQPIGNHGSALAVISRQNVESEGVTRDMIYLGEGVADATGALSIVRDVEGVQIDRTLTILGERSGVRVDSDYVGGLRVIGSKKNPGRLSGGAIAGITIGAIAGAALVGLGIYGLTQIDLDLGGSFNLGSSYQ